MRLRNEGISRPSPIGGPAGALAVTLVGLKSIFGASGNLYPPMMLMVGVVR
jgi:hypothetical protein